MSAIASTPQTITATRRRLSDWRYDALANVVP